MKKTIGIIGIVAVIIFLLCGSYYESTTLGYFTNDTAEFLTLPMMWTMAFVYGFSISELIFKN